MNLCGINISCHKRSSILHYTKRSKILVTVNAEAIVRAQSDLRLKSFINNNMASIDGQIPLWLYRKKYPNIQIEKISGSDLIYDLCAYASNNNLKVFLLGGKKNSNYGAAIKLRELYPALQIDGFSPDYQPYPFTHELDSLINDKLIDFKPDILFVGFGMGKQEYWEEDHESLFNSIGIKLVIGCGGSFEFASGMIKRAPYIVQKIGLEGLWRLLMEFKWYRFKRLLISCKIFYYYICT